MGLFEAAQVLRPVSDASPCGENPEYSDEFQRLDMAAHGREESQFAAAEEPDWREVERAALSVLENARELRSLGYLAQAFLHRGDWSSFAQAMQAVAGLLEDYWDCVYPQLDPADGDATERINAIESLAHPDMLLRALRQAPLLDSKAVGRFSVRDIAVALGKMPPGDDEAPPDMTLITAAATSLAPEDIATVHHSLQTAKNALVASSRTFAERLSASDAPDLDALVHLLDLSSGFLESFLPQEAEVAPESAAVAGAAGTFTPQPVAAPGEIRSRDDVVAMIDRVCNYYARNEPSSPVPILMKRARYLVHKSFPEILADLVPAAASEFSVFEGRAGSAGEEAGAGAGESESESSW